MIQFSDHVMAIHNDRQRRFEAEARQASMASQARRNGRKARRFMLRRKATARPATPEPAPPPA